jgi:cytochrome c peroxidase
VGQNLFWDGRASGLENQAVFPLTHPDEMGQSLEMSAKKLAKTTRYPSLFRQVFGTSSITGEQITKALAQFERTLISADSPYDRSLKGNYRLTASERRGMELFMRGPAPERGVRGGNCAHCHGGAKLMQEVFHNNGWTVSQQLTEAGKKFRAMNWTVAVFEWQLCGISH